MGEQNKTKKLKMLIFILTDFIELILSKLVRKGVKNYFFSSLLLLRGPATPQTDFTLETDRKK